MPSGHAQSIDGMARRTTPSGAFKGPAAGKLDALYGQNVRAAPSCAGGACSVGA